MAYKKSDELNTLSVEDRKAIGNAIIEGLINPVGLSFERLATEGGDYDQGNGPYTQSGGGTHDQGDGGYTQTALIRENFLDIVTVANILKHPSRG